MFPVYRGIPMVEGNQLGSVVLESQSSHPQYWNVYGFFYSCPLKSLAPLSKENPCENCPMRNRRLRSFCLAQECQDEKTDEDMTNDHSMFQGGGK
jgi:hypothetical protein